MKRLSLLSVALASYWGAQYATAAPSVSDIQKRDGTFNDGQPYNGKDKGAPLLGM